MISMLHFWWAFSTFTICISSKYLLVEVDSNQLGDRKLKETVESRPEKDLLRNRSISNFEHIPEIIENIPRMEMSGMIHLHYFIKDIHSSDLILIYITTISTYFLFLRTKFNLTKFKELPICMP